MTGGDPGVGEGLRGPRDGCTLSHFHFYIFISLRHLQRMRGYDMNKSKII